MPQTSIDLINLFASPPGETIYYWLVILVALAGVFMTLGPHRQSADESQWNRYVLAFSGMFFVWLALLVGMVFALSTNRDPKTILPPVERLAQNITLLLIISAFLSSSPLAAKRAKPIIVLLIVLSLVGYVLTAINWIDLAGTEDFNLSVYGISWTGISLVISGIGLLWIAMNLQSIRDVPLKLVMLSVLVVGSGWTLWQSTQGNIIGDYAGMLRLSFVVSLMITLVILYRAVLVDLIESISSNAQSPISETRTEVTATLPQTVAPRAPIERESVQLLRALGLILEEATSDTIPQRIIDAVIEVLKVDIVGLIQMQDANYADFVTVRDAFMSRSLSPMALNLDNQPTLSDAVERRSQRRIIPDEDDGEIQDFYTRLEIDQVGPVYFQPLVHDSKLVAILIIAQPYTRRELYKAESEMLKGIAVIAGGLLALSFAAVEARMMAEERAIHAMIRGVPAETVRDSDVISARQETEASLQLAREQIAELSKQVAMLSEELDAERNRVVLSLDTIDDDLTMSQRFRAVTAEQQRIIEERDGLVRRLQEAEAALAGATATDSEAVVQQMIEAFEREKSDLQAQRARLQKELAELRSGATLPQIARRIIDEINAQKQILTAERDQLQSDLDAIQQQLDDVGIEIGPAGLSQLINQLYRQNADLHSANATLRSEIERMSAERNRLEQAIEMEEARAMRIQMLEGEVRNLAEDREALAKQREKLRVERDELRARIDEIKQHRARLMAQVASYEIEIKEAHAVQNKLRADIRRLSDANSDLISERDRLQSAKDAAETDREQILAVMRGDRDRLQAIGENGVGSLKSMIEKLTEQRNALQHELTETRTILADMQNQLEVLQVQVEGQSVDVDLQRYEAQNPELFLGLAQELRTPMTSIRGYIDLLLAESAGILGEMQRKFLQRVFTNSKRLEAMIDDLVQMTQLDAGTFKLQASPVDVIALIENSITHASPQFREKRLSVNLMLDDDAPAVLGDGDAISQVIGQLLTNAYLVSPPDSEISIRAEYRTVRLSNGGSVDLVDCLYVSFEDRGGGIQPEDEARVFARKYRADHPLIEGLGDTGVGLSVAKALVEAHGGALWMRSHENVGTVFSFALPVNNMLQVKA